MRTPAWLTLAVSVVTSALVWALSPVLTGQPEPWDADGAFYILALAIAGAVAGLLTPRPAWAHYVGAVVGQLGYELVFLRVGPLVVVGALFLLGYSLVFLVTAILAAQVRLRAQQ
jgi:hypothetical protein